MANKKSGIIVAGSINMDISLHVAEIPTEGETIMVSKRTFSPGGKGANQAVAASKLGADVSLIAAVGGDDDGRVLIETLEEYGVNTSGIIKTNNNSGNAFITVSNSGANMIMVDPGANNELTPENISAKKELFESSEYCLIQLEIPTATVNKVIEYCKINDVKIVLNYSPVQPIENIDINGVKYFIINETELEFCLGKKYTEINDDEIHMFREKYNIDTIILTLGKNGVKCISDHGIITQDATDDLPVDTTGAGDSFLGSFVTAISSLSMDIESALTFAQKCAGITVTRFGAQNAMPYLSEINN